MLSVKRFGVLLGIVLIVSSCTSSQRLTRILPFSEAKTGLPDSGRVNFWPLAYHNAGATSILWPLIDFDDQGFAVRPLLAKDEDDVSLLWPVSGWNVRNGDGWFLNAYFDFKPDFKYFGVFPVCHVGDEGGFFLNAYWNDSGKGLFPLLYLGEEWSYAVTSYWNDECWGVFPLTHMQKDMSGGYLFPFFWTEDSVALFPLFYHSSELSLYGPVWRGEGGAGVFPLYTHYKDEDTSGHNVLGVLANFENGPDHHESWVLPLYYLDSGKDRRTFASPLGGSYERGEHKGLWLMPLWWNDTTPNSHDTLLFPLYYSSHQGDSKFFMTPMAAHGSTGDTSWTWCFPTWYSESSSSSSSANLFPIWGRRAHGDSVSSWLFPLYYHGRDGDEHSIYTPFWNRCASADSHSFNVYPFWWSRERGDESVSALLPIYLYRNDAGKKSLVTPLGGYGWGDDGDDAFVNVLGPMFHHQESTDGTFELTAAAWPLYTRWRKNDDVHEYVPLIYSRHQTPDRLKVGFAAELCQIDKGPDGTSWMVWPLVCQSDQSRLPNPIWNMTLVKHHATDVKTDVRVTPLFWYSKDAASVESGLFPLYDYERTTNETDLDALLCMIDYTRDSSGSSWRFWPLVAHSKQRHRPDPLYYLSLTSFREFENEGSWWVTPFVGSAYSGKERTTWTVPVAWWTTDEDSFNARFLAGFGGIEYEKKAFRKFDLFPLVSISKDTRPGWLHDLYLFNWRSVDGDGYDFGIFPLLGFHSSGTPGVDAKGRFNILGPLVFDRETADDATCKSSATQVLLLGYGRKSEYVENSVPSVSASPTTVENSGIFPFYYTRKHCFREWKPGIFTTEEKTAIAWWWKQVVRKPHGHFSDTAIIEILQAQGVELGDADRGAVKLALLKYATKNCREFQSSRFNSWVYRYDRKDEDKDWSFMFGMVNHKTEIAKGTSRTRVLRYLYSSETKGDEVRTSFFPFCKKDSGRKWSDFSFGWRLWHMRTDNGKKSGHVLFIPWGKKT